MTRKKIRVKNIFGNRWGAALMLGIFGLLFLCMFFRIVYIQATGSAEGQDLAARAEQKHTQNQLLTASRGKILDKNGSVIAEDELTYKMFAIVTPEISKNEKEDYHVVDADKTAKVLAKYIDLPAKKIKKILVDGRNNGKYQVEFGKYGSGVQNSVKLAIEKYELPGINFEAHSNRFYPNGVFASNLIGIVSQDEETGVMKGNMGIEKIYNEELSGKNGNMSFQSDLWGFLLPNKNESVKQAEDGDNIYLTIDKMIQSFLEDAVSDVQEKYSPETITAIIADPSTGKILGMTQRPTFNLQTRDGLQNSWANFVTEETIEPGSTMKTFTLATAIQKGVWNPNATFQSGQYKVYTATIRDSNKYGWGRITYLEGIQRSSNVGMANLLKSIGGEAFMDSLKAFGFGEKTGIDLPNEATGKLLNEYPINRVTTAYGQGSTVTPIQLIQAYTAIANDGKMMQPYVIDKIVNPNSGKVIEKNKPTVKGEPISAETAKQVRDTLATTVTSEVGTARKFASEDYTVTGKTGTAQIPKTGGGYYWGKSEFLYSFLGSAPADKPQLVMYIAVKKPKLTAEKFGSDPTSEIFNEVMGKSLKYLNVEPDTIERTEGVQVDNYIDETIEQTVESLKDEKLSTVMIGENGTQIIDQYPKKGEKILVGNHLFLRTDSSEISLPDMKGWSLRDVLTYESLAGINFEIDGEGFVTKQSLPKGTMLDSTSKLKITLKKSN